MKSLIFYTGRYNFPFDYFKSKFEEAGVVPTWVTFYTNCVEITFKDEYDCELADDILRKI